MRKFNRLKYIFFLLFFTLFLIPAVDCSFISGGTESNAKLTPFGNANAVAYIGSTNYVTIESALRNAKSGDKVFVIPGTNPIINQSCIVKSGVELYIPYENEVWENRESAGIGNFADSTTSYINTYKKNEVKINTGVSLTIESGGSLYIGGQTGNTGQPMQGHTSGKYTQITLYDNAQIINYGNVKCFGYIKEQSKDNNSKFLSYSGEVYSPLVVYDYRGGTSTAGVYKSSDTGAPISPFNVIDMPNIQVFSAYYYGTNLYGYVNLYTGQASMSAAGATVTIKARYNYEEIKVISSNTEAGIFELSSSGYITTKFNTYFDDNNICLTKNTLTTTLDLYNNATFNVMSLSINAANDVTVDPSYLEWVAKPIIQGLLNTTITTEDVYFPVSYKMDIILHEGNFTAEGKLKFLPGSKIVVNKGANLTLNDTIFYTDFIDTSYGSYVYPTSIDGVALERAKIIVNGNLTLVNKNDDLVNSGSGGIIDTIEDNAILSVLTTNLTATSYDGHGTRDEITFNFIPNSNSPKVENLRGVMSITNTNNDGTSNFSYGFYVSKNQKWVSVDESELGSYTLNFNANGGNYNGETSIQVKYLLSSSNPKIESINVPNPTKDNYDFAGWYIEGTETPALNYPVTNGGIYNLTAKYLSKNFEIVYSVTYDNLETVNYVNNNITEFDSDYITTNTIVLSPATDNNYKFLGWYSESEMINIITEIDSNYVKNHADDDNKIYLYGTFTLSYEVNFIFENAPTEFDTLKPPQTQIVKPNSKLNDLPNYEAYITNTDCSKYFDGWYYESGELFNFENSVTSDLTLVGKWLDKSSIIINYRNKDNVYEQKNKYFVDGRNDTLNLNLSNIVNTYLPDGTQFGGWWDQSGNQLTENISYYDVVNSSSLVGNAIYEARYKYRVYVDVEKTYVGFTESTCKETEIYVLEGTNFYVKNDRDTSLTDWFARVRIYGAGINSTLNSGRTSGYTLNRYSAGIVRIYDD